MSYCLYGCRIRAYTGVVYGRIRVSYMGVYDTRINGINQSLDDRLRQSLLLVGREDGCGVYLLATVCCCLHTA